MAPRPSPNKNQDNMADHDSFSIDRTQQRLGPIWLSPDILPRNAVTLFLSGAMAMGFINLLNLLQPYLLKEHLGMLASEGAFTANLYIAIEIMTLAVAAPIANLSDIVGRRPIFTTGFLIICIGLGAVSAARTPEMLAIARIGTAVGIACCTTMIASLIADYPQNASRGKFIGLNGIFASLGVIVVGSGMTQLPKVFAGMGFSAIEAGTLTLWIGSGAAILTGLLTWAGIRGGRVSGDHDRIPFLQNARIGLSRIRKSPRLVLGCGVTALSRGDLTVIASFFSLWVVKAGTELGIDTGAAQARAGMLFGIVMFSMLLSLPVMAIVVDRLDRVTTVCIAIALAGIGYFALGFAPNPFGPPLIFVAAILAGIGEGAMIITVPALIGQEAPKEIRGSIIGVAASFGALGIIVTNKASGWLFDNWSFQSPFVFMGFVNASILVWAVAVRLRAGSSRARQESQSATEAA